MEAGIELSPYFSDAYQAGNGMVLKNRLALKFMFSKVPVNELAHKLTEIYERDAGLAMALLKTIEMYDWVISGGSFKKLPLDGGILDLADGDTILIANRRGKTIYLSKGALELMDASNLAGTVIHEALYALIRPKTMADGDRKQSGARVREINAFLFGRNHFGSVINMVADDELPISAKVGPGYDATLIDSPLASPLVVQNYSLVLRKWGGNYLEEKGTRLFRYLPKDIWVRNFKEMCRTAPAQRNISYSLDLESENDSSLYRLQWDTYQEKSEEKFYIQFIKQAEGKTKLHSDILFPPTSSEEECVEYLVRKAERALVDYSLVYDVKTFTTDELLNIIPAK